mmetsp:Transcript_34381/g.110672  ORF Transcript_34381/g.110672 Transcript_34381/m.110672 type:complete len:222 (-) Transcript_34381:26-691(-)
MPASVSGGGIAAGVVGASGEPGAAPSDTSSSSTADTSSSSSGEAVGDGPDGDSSSAGMAIRCGGRRKAEEGVPKARGWPAIGGGEVDGDAIGATLLARRAPLPRSDGVAALPCLGVAATARRARFAATAASSRRAPDEMTGENFGVAARGVGELGVAGPSGIRRRAPDQRIGFAAAEPPRTGRPEESRREAENGSDRLSRRGIGELNIGLGLGREAEAEAG